MDFGKRTLPIAALAVGLIGCGPKVHEARFRSVPVRTAPEQVSIFQTTSPECRFEEVGTLTVEKRNAFVSSQEMVEALRVRASRMGGDAVVGLSEGSRVGGATAIGSTLVVANRQTFTTTVIRFTDTDCRRD